MLQEAAFKKHVLTEAKNAKRINENPQAAREEQDALLAPVARATDVDATSREHPLDLKSTLHDYVADSADSKDAGKRPRDKGQDEVGDKATSKQARIETSRTASSTATPELREELDSPDKRVE